MITMTPANLRPYDLDGRAAYPTVTVSLDGLWGAPGGVDALVNRVCGALVEGVGDYAAEEFRANLDGCTTWDQVLGVADATVILSAGYHGEY